MWPLYVGLYPGKSTASGYTKSSSSTPTSLGMSTSTGPGRPVVAMWNAARMTVGQLTGAAHEEVVLRYGQRDARDVRLLERVPADERPGHVARDGYQGNRVHKRRGQAGHQIGGAGARRGQADARAAGGARIAVGHVGRALLVPAQHRVQTRIVQRIVQVEHRPAGVPEDVLHAFGLQALDERLRTQHAARFPPLLSMPGLLRPSLLRVSFGRRGSQLYR